jgi:hypothetical protein
MLMIVYYSLNSPRLLECLMSVAYYIVLDKDDPGFETFVNGKAVAHALEELDALCDQAGLPKLENFMGQSMDEFAELLDDDIELPAGEEFQATWFEPEDGIVFIDTLVQAIRSDPGAVSDREEVLEDLSEYKNVLTQTAAIAAKWHLAIDF